MKQWASHQTSHFYLGKALIKCRPDAKPGEVALRSHRGIQPLLKFRDNYHNLTLSGGSEPRHAEQRALSSHLYFPRAALFTEAASHARDMDSRQEIYCIMSAAPRLLLLYHGSFLRVYFRCEFFFSFVCRVSSIGIRLRGKDFASVP